MGTEYTIAYAHSVFVAPAGYNNLMQFPIDMLRQERLFAATGDDSNKIALSFMSGFNKEWGHIHLVRIADKDWTPNSLLWTQSGWAILGHGLENIDATLKFTKEE